ncbi:C4-dicarboxylate transporter/malic acid transport protein [Deinococcus metalli]|uniref:C4-dicarboxylate ABC transporter n=1 Tax=Deinococcus metalli TaxID=1141878 RepID=A0A7W8KFL6_9DEIO|nr:TDT family transporter [Deinococcus metalli]MBB5377307.1 C4-dicarboxylate transporter/malic acid transport protein [Deinococcus metalli]GHF47479.1 C4-dicarboxylate ABC transporter [Deinococcus metalli]
MTTPCASAHPEGLAGVVRGFTPNWFAATMGTGILALLLPHVPVPGAALLGEGLWWMNMAVFAVFTGLSVARLALYPHESRATLVHPVQSMFLGALPMGLATLINGLIVYGVPRWGAGAAWLARDLWAFDALLSVLVGLLVPYVMFTRQDHALERMTGVWLLPVVASEVAAASAGLIAPHLSEHAAAPLVYAGYVLFALSVPLALMLIAVLILRLAQHGLPTPDLAVSMFLPLGPLATGALALLQLGDAAPRVLAAQGLGALAPTLTGMGLVGGLVLWGFGGWWLALATMTTLHVLRRGLPFNLGWWGLTFPLGVYAAATFSLGALTHLNVFSTLGHVLVTALTALWTLVTVRTVRGACSGHLFAAALLPREQGLPATVPGPLPHAS